MKRGVQVLNETLHELFASRDDVVAEACHAHPDRLRVDLLPRPLGEIARQPKSGKDPPVLIAASRTALSIAGAVVRRRCTWEARLAAG